MIFGLFWIKLLSQNFHWMYCGKKQCLEGEVAALWSLWLLKRVLKILIITSPSEVFYPPKYIRPESIQEPYMPPGITYNPCSDSCGGGFVFLKEIIFGPSTTINKIPISKFWLDIFEEMMSVGRLVALKSVLTLKKGTITSNFKSNETHLKFIQPPIP